MLFKLSISNIRKSIRDYAVYFFTLIVGVAVFYLFNSIEAQDAFQKYIANDADEGETIKTALKGLGIFVSTVLGLLIVYASRFLMKRRHKEFAIYLMLGMGKRKVSLILFIETLIIGIGSLAIGLLTGIGLSQFMSALVTDLFEADLTAYKFVVSADAIKRTVLYFGIAYIVVMLFNSLIISKCRLIDLIHSGKRSETVKVKNPWVCIAVFIAASVILSFCYYLVAFDTNDLSTNIFFGTIITGAICTLLIFWSISGLFLRLAVSVKGVYYKGLNSFTFRQISSKVNTTVISMTVICLFLFVTICSLTASFAYREAINKEFKECCPADVEIELINYDYIYSTGNKKAENLIDATPTEIAENSGISEYFSEYAAISIYYQKKAETDIVNHFDLLGKYADEYTKGLDLNTLFTIVDPNVKAMFMKLSDYNALMQVFGRDNVTMSEDEYFVLADEQYISRYYDKAAADGVEINLYGRKLKPAFDKHIYGSVDIKELHYDTGVVIVPDSLLADKIPAINKLLANYKTSDKETMRQNDKEIKALAAKWLKNNYPENKIKNFDPDSNIVTKIKLSDTMIGGSAMVTFIGLYLGLTFLIVCAAIIALKQLSDCADSIERYETLRRIGAEEISVSRSLLIQTGVFFLLPLMVAVIHSIFGIKFGKYMMSSFTDHDMLPSILKTSGILLLIYGGYFIITYLCGRSMIRSRRN